jgi:hypothetical protein
VHNFAAIYETLAGKQRLEPLDFVSKFGFLQMRGRTESVETFLGWRQAVGELVKVKALGEDSWPVAKVWLEANPQAMRLTGVYGEDEAGRMQPHFQPRDLLSFIVAQLVMDWGSGAQYRWCRRPGCHKFFYFGSGTGKRNRARYCDVNCKAAHHHMMRKGDAK